MERAVDWESGAAGHAQQEAVLSCILDMGELLLTAGAEIMRVEDTIARLCAAYGFCKIDVFTITSSIVLTVQTSEGRVLTQTRRIRLRETDFGCVERVNALSRRLCSSPEPVGPLREAIEQARKGPVYSEWVRLAVYAAVAAAFSVFFGGTAWDAFASGLSGLLLFAGLKYGGRLRLNGILLTLLCSALAALAIVALGMLGLGDNPDKIIIGNIMLLIPGLALTTSLRDIISGDTISGLLGLSEAVLKALAIAIGFAAVFIGLGG